MIQFPLVASVAKTSKIDSNISSFEVSGVDYSFSINSIIKFIINILFAPVHA